MEKDNPRNPHAKTYKKSKTFTPLRISNAHGNVAFAPKNSPQVGVLNVQRRKRVRFGKTLHGEAIEPDKYHRARRELTEEEFTAETLNERNNSTIDSANLSHFPVDIIGRLNTERNKSLSTLDDEATDILNDSLRKNQITRLSNYTRKYDRPLKGRRYRSKNNWIEIRKHLPMAPEEVYLLDGRKTKVRKIKKNKKHVKQYSRKTI